MTDDFVDKFLDDYIDDQNDKEIERGKAEMQKDMVLKEEKEILQLVSPSFSKIGAAIQTYAEKINEKWKPAEKLRVEIKNFDITVNFSGYVAWLHFKYKATRRLGTDPCIDIHFGKEMTGVGNGAPTRVLLPALEDGKLIWQVNGKKLYSPSDVAQFVLEALRRGSM